MSAVARDSPQMMGEAADTPGCPVLQRESGWVRGSTPSDSAEMRRGGAGPPSGITTPAWSWRAAHTMAFKHADSLLVDSCS